MPFLAAVPMTYFGVHYDAGDTIDTEGWSDTAVVRLMRRAPVYYSAGGNGTSESSVKVVKCDFAFDTPDLLTGAVVYTPTVGDVLLDAWIAVTAPWDGTTPMGDFGTFDVVGWGTFFALLSGHAVDMTAGGAGEVVSNALHNAASGITFAGPSDIFQAQVQFATGVGSISELSPEIRHFPAEFVTADPIKVVVSQDGTNTGADTASSAGAASLYLVVATPVVPS